MAGVRLFSTNIKKILQTGTVHENTNANLFYIILNETQTADVQYKKINDVYDLVHTNIPNEYQGQGLGTILAQRVFDHLVQKKKKIKLTCEFLQHFYSQNKNKYSNFVVQ